MKIEIGQPSYIAPLDVTHKKTATSSAGGAAKPDSKAYSVDFSMEVGLMNTPVPAEDAVRQQKVDEIRYQLATGTYNLSGRDVANKILNALKE